MTIIASQRLTLPDYTILMNLLELQAGIHFKPLEEVDTLRISDSCTLNRLLLEVKQSVKECVCSGSGECSPMNLETAETILVSNVLDSMMELRTYLGLNNYHLSAFKRRLAVDYDAKSGIEAGSL